MAFASIVSAPPGGEWFWEDKDVFIHTATYQGAIDAIRKHFNEHGITRNPVTALAEYMCPRMPRGFCTGDFSSKEEPTVAKLLENTQEICRDRTTETIDVIQHRLDICAKCNKCARPTCISCRQIDQKIYLMLKGRRAPLPLDRTSGVCACCGAFTMALASVQFKQGESLEGAPDTCWRNRP